MRSTGGLRVQVMFLYQAQGEGFLGASCQGEKPPYLRKISCSNLDDPVNFWCQPRPL